jgi:hypothetical protein
VPSPDDILAGLRLASQRSIPLAAVWHVLVSIALIAVVAGRRPSRRLAAVASAAPVFSASAVAYAFGNPFNGTLLGAAGLALVSLAWRFGDAPVQLGGTFEKLTGAAMVVFAWVYPHFLEGLGTTTYLWAAPMGIIPCPTLALVIGFTLLFGGFGSRSWCLVLAAVALFYGVFGVTRLRVALDVILVGGASALLVRALRGLSADGARALARGNR